MGALIKTIAERIVQRPLASLVENPRNARTHSRAQIKQIEKLIKEVGF